MFDKKDLEIMAKRLTFLYGKSQAQEIMLRNHNRLWTYKGLAWSLGKRDLTFFNLCFLRNVFIGENLSELADIHYEIWETINGMYVKDTHTRHAFILPRGTGKSVTGSLPAAVWANVYKYSVYTVVASAVNDTAMTFINNIRNALKDNKRIEQVFGKIYSDELINTTEKIELANGTMIQAMPSRSTFRGKSYLGNRIGLLILDDFQSEENVSSKEQMKKHWKRFSTDSGQAVQRNKYKMLAMGTIIEKGDFYYRLTKTPTWKHTKEKAILIDDNKLDKYFNSGKWLNFKKLLFDFEDKNRLESAKHFYRENEKEMIFPMLWNQYWDCLEMALNYYENPESFKQEMQQITNTNVNRKFKNFNFVSETLKGNVLAIDPATSGKDKSDYTAFIIAANNEECIDIEYGVMERLEFEDYISKTVELLKMFTNIDTILVEKQTYNKADVIAMQNVISRDEELSERTFKWINEHQSKNKDAKINSIVGDVNLGRIRFNNILKNTKEIEQVEEFTTTALVEHDDFVDVLSEIVLYLKEQNIKDDDIESYDIGLLF